jgi:GTP cyclohydrolase I
MNLHAPDLDRDLSRAEAEDALAILRRWAVRATPEEVADLDPAVARLLPAARSRTTPTSPAPIPTSRPTRSTARRCRTCRTAPNR